MGQLGSFKKDGRIQPRQREELRSFANTLGADIVELAQRLGVLVHFEDLPLDEAGYIEHAPTCGSASEYRIVVNSSQSPVRQRFTVAHELGHYVLHRNDGEMVHRQETKHRFPSKRDYQTDEKSIEYEADAFAIALLLPPALVRQETNRGVYNPETLSRKFVVSSEAMRLRLEELGFDPNSVGKLTRVQRLSDPYGLLGWSKPDR